MHIDVTRATPPPPMTECKITLSRDEVRSLASVLIAAENYTKEHNSLDARSIAVMHTLRNELKLALE